MKKIYETPNGYRLDRLTDEQDEFYEKLSNSLQDNQKYCFDRYHQSVQDRIQLIKEMFREGQLN